MKEKAIIVSPLFSLESIMSVLHRDTVPFHALLSHALKTYPFDQKRSVLFVPLPSKLQIELSVYKQTRTAASIADTFGKQGYEVLPLPYLIGLLQKQKILSSFFPRDIQSVEIIDPLCILERFSSKYSVCLRRINNQIMLSMSEYVKDGVVNASGNISPRSVQFLVEQGIEKKISNERHVRLTTGLIG